MTVHGSNTQTQTDGFVAEPPGHVPPGPQSLLALHGLHWFLVVQRERTLVPPWHMVATEPEPWKWRPSGSGRQCAPTPGQSPSVAHWQLPVPWTATAEGSSPWSPCGRRFAIMLSVGSPCCDSFKI